MYRKFNWCSQKDHKEAQYYTKKDGQPRTVEALSKKQPSANNIEATKGVKTYLQEPHFMLKLMK